MLTSVRDLVHLRWRTAQLVNAMADGNRTQARAVRQAMRIEGIADGDMRDEFRLLLAEFGARTPWWLRAEASRLWHALAELCVCCGRRSRHLDLDYVCADCVIEGS